MTKDELFFYIESKKDLEVIYNNKKYAISYGKNSNNEERIYFGLLYEGKEFTCFNDLYARAKIDNSYFKEMLDDITVVS